VFCDLLFCETDDAAVMAAAVGWCRWHAPLLGGGLK